MLSPQPRPRQALDYVSRNGIVLVFAAALSELREVIRRLCFNRYLLEGQRREFLYNLEQEAELVPITHYITGDHDLLAPHPFRSIPIITPATS